MLLHNKYDGLSYIVTTEDDETGGFMIMATPVNPEIVGAVRFCMHYRSLNDFYEEWEDAKK